ncbi:uncharacterized protein PSANT_05575 [Moesziomyces antarcticus]|nr:uncharacterized protein PSANT_05575 [Moesziomyces antarcticus]
MQDREFTMTKSLLTVLVGRSSRSNNAGAARSKVKAAAAAADEEYTSNSAHRHRFDDKSGGPPPRGSLTDEKLPYLDWRLKRINTVRHKSEGTAHCWIDGRDTIGRTSLDSDRPLPVAAAAAPRKEEFRAPASKQLPTAGMVASSTLPAIYAEEKDAGLKALEHAYAGDSMLADMPRLAKRDTGSDSGTSGASDQHHISLAPVQLHATADKDVGVYFSKPKRSLLVRTGSRFGMKKAAGARTTDGGERDVEDSRPMSRNGRSFSRIWNR